MNILLVGGTFGEVSKSSGLINKINDLLNKENHVILYNGGSYEELETIYNHIANTHYDVVFWLANVDNSYPKIRNVKDLDYKTLLINSKRNDNHKYTFQELLQRSLAIKANLTLEFSKNAENIFNIRLFDPLGNLYANTCNIEEVINVLLIRISYLLSVTRQSTTKTNANISFEKPNANEWISIVQHYAEDFVKYIPTVRFVGNASLRYRFRCSYGFPSFRTNNCIFMSQRNINKNEITMDNFVPVFEEDNKIFYIGENKPSVDTPIQIKLYKEFPNINYILHSHCYLKGEIFTNKVIPCGAIEEFYEIKNTFTNRNLNEYKINLKGHGSIVMANSLKTFENLNYVKRPCPELQI